jgi:hypothetical protein
MLKITNPEHRYNSAISTTTPQFTFPALVVTESFLTGAPMGNEWIDENQAYNATIATTMQRFANDSARYQRIEKGQCAAHYSDPFYAHSNLVVVTEDSKDRADSSLLEYMRFDGGTGNWSIWDLQMWICSSGFGHNRTMLFDLENPDCFKKDFSTERLDHWQKYDHDVQYCLSLRQTNEFCALNFSPAILLGKLIGK